MPWYGFLGDHLIEDKKRNSADAREPEKAHVTCLYWTHVDLTIDW